MCERHETVIIGGGQAGLCVSYYLTRHGREHIVVERGRVAESWRSQRWDGFYLNTPNWTIQLPGGHYRGDDPDLFMPRDDVVTYVERYAESFRAPLRCGVGVSSLTRRSRSGYLLETSEGALEAENVVVATGAFQRPKRVPLARDLPPRIFQVHASEYRCPAQLPEGAVLVVGSGSSGCQIAEELREHGREVYLSVGSCPWSPRRYRGRDFMGWAIELGLMDETVDSSPRAKLACNQSLSGNNGGHDCHPRSLARMGVVLVGRVEAVARRKIVLRPDLHENLAKIDQFAASFKQQVDRYVSAARLDGFDQSAAADPSEPDDAAPTEQLHELDLGRSGIGTVLWANGYRSDFRWICLRLFDAEGWPVQVRGVTASPGLYFVGVNWLYKRKSALLLGVGEDAEYVAGHIVRTSARRD